MDCVLGRCPKCPKYKIPKEELDIGPAAPQISFSVTKTIEVTRRGAPRKRKFQALLSTSIGSQGPFQASVRTPLMKQVTKFSKAS